ncbi:response regulator transcription factor [Pseudoalteromonas sp. OOF1S-7]|uniref:response regulator transcription factor n=1 Tax=Pseudoalteromonas sp. OOF1S-7 TaxID=2917757 RepID=UPI001EF48A71|nr:response regulator transcription factor [Pseudoalteromonas sp. OOF1S-7]MCG7536325.1 response regulator transcription factor [Pseudoalteromonas sp. OOF1S-7]
MSANVLIIDDDRGLCELLQDYLQGEGCKVYTAYTGPEGLDMALTREFDVILLDVMLPQLDGFEVLKALRTKKMTPVIMLTAKGDDFDRIFGLELGADDYIPKPFNHRELLARIKAITRRVAHLLHSTVAPSFKYHDLVLDLPSRTANIKGTPLPLTGTEYEMLYQLVKSAGQTVTKQTLSQTVLGRPLAPYDRSVDMHVSNVRKKIAQYSSHTYIKTLRGSGYIFLKA